MWTISYQKNFSGKRIGCIPVFFINSKLTDVRTDELKKVETINTSHGCVNNTQSWLFYFYTGHSHIPCDGWEEWENSSCRVCSAGQRANRYSSHSAIINIAPASCFIPDNGREEWVAGIRANTASHSGFLNTGTRNKLIKDKDK